MTGQQNIKLINNPALSGAANSVRVSGFNQNAVFSAGHHIGRESASFFPEAQYMNDCSYILLLRLAARLQSSPWS